MSDEFNALIFKDTWEVVPDRSSQNLEISKWVYKIIYKSDDTVARYKGGLFVAGNHPQVSINFHETSYPAVHPDTIQLVLFLVVAHRWPIRQPNVKNAFLHGVLIEQVYMHQPTIFIDPSFPNHVCRVKKAIYG